MRMTPEFFEIINTRLEPRLARQAANYRAPISVGEKLALTIRYLATGESYTSLSCQWAPSMAFLDYMGVAMRLSAFPPLPACWRWLSGQAGTYVSFNNSGTGAHSWVGTVAEAGPFHGLLRLYGGCRAS